MESVSAGRLDDVGYWLHIPDSKQEEIEQQYPDVAQSRRAYCVYYLTNHPAASWVIVANALWKAGELESLEMVQKLYLKGEPCADSCRSEGRIGLCIMCILLIRTAFVALCVHCTLAPTM